MEQIQTGKNACVHQFPWCSMQFALLQNRQSFIVDFAEEQIALNTKEIDARKHSFQSVFVPTRKFNFIRKSMTKLKAKPTEMLIIKFESLHCHSKLDVEPPRPKHISKWTLISNLFGEKIWQNSQPDQTNQTKKLFAGYMGLSI